MYRRMGTLAANALENRPASQARPPTSQLRMEILDERVAVKRVYANRPAWQMVSC